MARPLPSQPSAALQRRLSLPLLVLYGIGITIGAGIYVLIGAGIRRKAGGLPSTPRRRERGSSPLPHERSAWWGGVGGGGRFFRRAQMGNQAHQPLRQGG
jgi:hypothetical protein